MINEQTSAAALIHIVSNQQTLLRSVEGSFAKWRSFCCIHKFFNYFLINFIYFQNKCFYKWLYESTISNRFEYYFMCLSDYLRKQKVRFAKTKQIDNLCTVNRNLQKNWTKYVTTLFKLRKLNEKELKGKRRRSPTEWGSFESWKVCFHCFMSLKLMTQVNCNCFIFDLPLYTVVRWLLMSGCPKKLGNEV